MPKTTKKEIEDAIERLRFALLEAHEASLAEDKAKTRKIKAQYELQLAREQMRAIQFNQQI